jgi:hypothetical protein
VNVNGSPEGLEGLSATGTVSVGEKLQRPVDKRAASSCLLQTSGIKVLILAALWKNGKKGQATICLGLLHQC